MSETTNAVRDRLRLDHFRLLPTLGCVFGPDLETAIERLHPDAVRSLILLTLGSGSQVTSHGDSLSSLSHAGSGWVCKPGAALPTVVD